MRASERGSPSPKNKHHQHSLPHDEAETDLGAAHGAVQETATSLGGVGESGGDAELKEEFFFRADEMPEACAEEFMDSP